MNKRVTRRPSRDSRSPKKALVRKEVAREVRRERGAKTSETSMLGLLSAWYGHHWDSCIDSVKRLLQTPMQSVLTWMVIAIAVSLPAALYLGLQNVQQLGDGWEDSAQMSVFLDRRARSQAIQNLQKKLRENSNITNVDLITPGNALAEFQEYSGLGDVLNELDENPLPNVLVIQPNNDVVSSPDLLALLKKEIEAYPLVDQVQLDMGWLRRLNELLALSERIVMALAGLLSLGVLLVIGNTLRLAIENRRDEIVVTKMVGGTNGFVRRPFLYTGFWYGFGGGVVALLLLFIVGIWLSGPIYNLIYLYDSDYSLYALRPKTIGILLAGTAFLGWLGSWIAVSRHLRAIEPR